MMNENYIQEIYAYFQKEQEIDFPLPQINPTFKALDLRINAQIEKITTKQVNISFNEKFLTYSGNKTYLDSILYHEFTHIIDSLSFLVDERDENGYTFQAFPYDEYHASQIQFLKMIEASPKIQKIDFEKDRVCVENGTISIIEFISSNMSNFKKNCRSINSSSNFNDILFLTYHVIYNMGYFSILNLFNVYKKFWIDYKYIPCVKDDFDELMNLLIHKWPSDELCKNCNTRIKTILSKLVQYFDIKLTQH